MAWQNISMRSRHHPWLLLLFLAFFVPAPLVAQQDPKPAAPKDQAPSPLNRLTIEVTGGDSNKPVENASVYVKTLEQHALKDKKFEVNVKTNQRGVAHVPDAPLGRVLIQIIAEGWKTYGHWYDITDPQQTVKIHLERPPKWY
jgi:hypothetical protein